MHKKRIALLLKRVVPSTLLLLTGTFFYCDLAEENRTNQLITESTFYVGQGANTLSYNLKQVAQDLLYLAGQNSLIDQITRPDQDNLKKLTENFIHFSGVKGCYDQIRWLDASGMERVRVDYAPDGPEAVPAHLLQYKGDRYYFQEAVTLRLGEIYISPLDLNIEHGQIERPFKPTIRLATPLIDPAGTQHGILLNENGLWIWSTAHPLDDVRTGSPDALQLLQHAPEHYLWKVVSHISRQELADIIRSIRIHIITVAFLLFLAVCAVSYRLVRAEEKLRAANAALEQEVRERTAQLKEKIAD
ncbi:MAG: hypothetical protein D3906_14005, partial [Candidatus Electrothrix sp. AUS1_2]|nr:hypothetical protein [Candidatus Electrothrix sp. AUS1_2]